MIVATQTGFGDYVDVVKANAQTGFTLFSLMRVWGGDTPVGQVCVGLSSRAIPADQCHAPDPTP